MADHSVREYLVSNPTALFGPGCDIRFCTAAPVYSVLKFQVDGRTVRALLTNNPQDESRFSAVLLVPAR